MMISVSVLGEGRHGLGKHGDISSHTFTEDGGISYLGRHPTLVFVSSITCVKDVLEHSPPFPHIIDYKGRIEHMGTTAAYDGEMAHALAQCDRVRRIRLCLPAQRLYRFLMVINGKYPIMEYLIMDISDYSYNVLNALKLP